MGLFIWCALLVLSVPASFHPYLDLTRVRFVLSVDCFDFLAHLPFAFVLRSPCYTLVARLVYHLRSWPLYHLYEMHMSVTKRARFRFR